MSSCKSTGSASNSNVMGFDSEKTHVLIKRIPGIPGKAPDKWVNFESIHLAFDMTLGARSNATNYTTAQPFFEAKGQKNIDFYRLQRICLF